MHTRALLPLLPLLTGCVLVSSNDDGADENPSTGDGDSTSGDGDGDGDGDGEPAEQWCGLSEGPEQPWFSLAQFGMPLEPGGELAVECGFQGFFMVEIRPTLGGFIPTSDSVNFEVTLDVEGYNQGPNGHFAVDDFNIYVACCDDDEPYNYDCYYLIKTFQLFPPDSIDDLSVIHGAPAQLEVTMNTPQGPISQTLDVSMWAMELGDEWQFCSFDEYYPSVDPLPISATPIPG